MILILIAIQLLFVSIESQIGSYLALNPTHCGLSRHSTENSSDCFKYHKSKAFDEIRNGRNATAGEVPWLVYLHIVYSAENGTRIKRNVKRQCTGSLFAGQWVLTAAHCVNVTLNAGWEVTKGPNVTVLSGYKFVYSQWAKQRQDLDECKISQQEYDKWVSDNGIIADSNTEWFKHPNHTKVTLANLYPGQSKPFRLAVNDIALIKLSEPIASGPLHNSICIPDQHYIEADNSYALVAGYGVMRSGVNYKDNRAQVAYTKIITSNDPLILTTVSPFNDTADLCSGDSGGPLWQYINGRAVILGVHNSGHIDQDDCNQKRPNYLARVSQFIDWISHVTQLDL